MPRWSVTLTTGLFIELTLAGSGWAQIAATSSLYALFGATVAVRQRPAAGPRAPPLLGEPHLR